MSWRACACLRSVMSRAIFDAPTIFPSRTFTGDTAQRDIDQTSVLTHANGFVMLNGLAPSNALEDFRLLILTLSRNEDRDRLADHFVGRIAEQPFCPWFQLMMIPSGFLLRMASSEDSTIAARRCPISSARLRSVMSTSMFTAPIRLPQASNRGVGIGNEVNASTVWSLCYRFHASDWTLLSAALTPSDTRRAAMACHQPNSSFHEPQNSLFPSSGRQPQSVTAASLQKMIRPVASVM